jgi:hypothetical protein
VLYSFCSQKICKDGEDHAGLTDAKGMFYGTTSEGGSFGRRCDFGCGTVSALTR